MPLISPKSFALRVLARPMFLRLGQDVDSVLILMFHGFRDSAAPGMANSEGKHLSGEKFDLLLSRLGKVFSFLSLPSLLDHLKRGDSPRGRSLVLTFDDGYESNYRVAFPLLKKHRAPATIFLATEFVQENRHLWTDRLEFALSKTDLTELDFSGTRFPLRSPNERIAALTAIKRTLKALEQGGQDSRIEEIESALGVRLEGTEIGFPPIFRPLTPPQIREMSESGLVGFGAHTHSHRILGRCDESAIRTEVRTSRDIVSRLTGESCDLFCYPNGQPGDFDDRTERILKEEGFRCALTTVAARNVRGSDPFSLGRLGISDRESAHWSLVETCGLLPKLRGMLRRGGTG